MTPSDNISEALKACPFCGGEPWYFQVKYDDGMVTHNIRCKKCHVAFDGYSSKELAVNPWNTRAATTPAAVVTVEDMYWDFNHTETSDIDHDVLRFIAKKYAGRAIIITADNEKED